MTINAAITFDTKKTQIQVDDLQLKIQLIETTTLPKKQKKETIFLLLTDRQVLEIGLIDDLKEETFNQVITINSDLDVEAVYLSRVLHNQLIENGVKLNDTTEQTVPKNIETTLSETTTDIFLILNKLGIQVEKAAPKKKFGKARHKWTKEVSEIEFHINTRDSIATVMWIKRNQMLIKKGATMMKEAPLNKDGSVGISARTAAQYRNEHAHAVKDFVTTEDIILKSVNEVGLFLYFAGTNSWLEMIDKDGKTLNEWTVVD